MGADFTQNFSDTECTPKCNNLGECRGLDKQSFVVSVIPAPDLVREQTPSPRLSYCSLNSSSGRSVPAPPEAVYERMLSGRLSHSGSADSQSTVMASPQI